jgi:hypothetical protein
LYGDRLLSISKLTDVLGLGHLIDDYHLQQSDFVALVFGDDDPFWLVEVTNLSENSLIYMPDSRQKNNFLPKEKQYVKKP